MKEAIVNVQTGELQEFDVPERIVYRFKTPWNNLNHGEGYEVNNMPSETVPDQSMSISEIMSRFAKGLPVGGAKVAFFEDEEDDLLEGRNPATLDLAEIQEIKDDFQQELQEIKEKYKKPVKSQDQKIQEEVEKQLEKQKGQKPDQGEPVT